jgi:hypothetical protein
MDYEQVVSVSDDMEKDSLCSMCIKREECKFYHRIKNGWYGVVVSCNEFYPDDLEIVKEGDL